eukprot:jgi/Tetstr1/461481/TSEL_006587.t1
MERVYRPAARADEQPTHGGEPTVANASSGRHEASASDVSDMPISIPSTHPQPSRRQSVGARNRSGRATAPPNRTADDAAGRSLVSTGLLSAGDAAAMHVPLAEMTMLGHPATAAAGTAYTQGMRGNTGGGGAMPRTGPHSQPTSRPSSRRQNHTAAAAAPSAAQPASVDALDSPPGSVSPDEVLFNRTMSGMGTELADIAELALGEGEGAGKLGAGAGPGHRDGVDYDATEEGADGDGGGDSDDDGDDDGNDDASGLPPEGLGEGEDTEGEASQGAEGTVRTAESQELLPRGHLMFHADYEGGNMESVKASADLAEYEVTLRHDSMAPRYRLWFWFTVNNATPGQRAIISVVNFSKTKSLYRHGMTPIVRSTSRPAWQRLPPKSVFYYRSSKHKNGYVLSFVFVFDQADDEYEFAYTYPYTYTHLQRQLASYDRMALPFCRRELLCRTPQMRRMDVLTICDPPEACLAAAEEPGEGMYEWQRNSVARLGPVLPNGARRPVVVLTARVHPGETPASFLCHGFLEFLLSSAPEAQALRREATWVVVPMLNPDGCFMGHYRADFAGVDLNRMWAAPSRELEPSLFHTLRVLSKYDRHPCFTADVFIDIHAHSTSKSGFLFCNPVPEERSSPGLLERSVRLPKLLDAHMLGFSLAACRWDADSSKAGCARRVAYQRCPNTLCYTLEASFFHCPDPNAPRKEKDDRADSFLSGNGAGISNGAGRSNPAERGWPWPNTEEGFLMMGRQLAQAMFDFYKLQKPSAQSQRPGARSSARGPRF